MNKKEQLVFKKNSFLEKELAAKNRELEIEASLERVREKAMAMHASAELKEVVKILFEELRHLDVNLQACLIATFDAVTCDQRSWIIHGKTNEPYSFLIPYNEQHFYQEMLKAWKEKNVNWSYMLEGEAKTKWENFLFTDTEFKLLPKEVKEEMGKPEKVFFAASYYQYGAIQASSPELLSKASIDILQRFSKVFDSCYTRFLDLQKAESQAREAQIQLALERVRARAMAMHNSEELKELISTVSTELGKLDFVLDRAFIMTFDPQTKDSIWWMYNPESTEPTALLVKYHEQPPYLAHLKGWEERQVKWTYLLEGEVKKEWDQFLFTKTELYKLPQVVITNMREKEKVYLYASYNNFGCLSLATLEPITDEQFDILLRFAKVFDLCYTRFNDLKQAEAQAKEAQIQLALERVRARTMAMHSSNELTEVTTLLFQQISSLKIKTWTTGFNVWSDDNNFWVDYVTNPDGGFLEPYTIDATQYPINEVSKAKKRGEEFFVRCEEGEKLAETYRQLSKFGEKQYKAIQDKGFQFPTKQYEHFVFGSKVSLMFITYEPVPEVHDIFKRFGKVFEQTYTRFLDLQKAEAQAREAQIELGLERVRARAMAMQKSDELADAAQLLYHEFDNLGINTFSCGYMFIDQEKQTQTAWVVLPDGSLLPNFIVFPLTGDAVLNARYKDWQEKKPLHIFEIQGEANKEHHRFLSDHVPLFVVQNIFSKIPDRIIFNCANFSDGYLLILATEFFSEEEKQTIIRFAKVFEMTYTRFLDLQKAEAQAKESQIETALEKVRSRTLAMQKSDELADTSAVLFKQLIHLGIAPNRLYIGIIHDKSGEIEFWITDEDGSKVSSKFTGNALNNPSIKKMYDGWAEQKKWIIIDMQGKELREYFHYLGEELRVPFKGGLSQKRRIQYLAYFSKGFIGMASPDEQPNETINLLERFAYVFNLTFIRFNDLQLAEAHALQAEQDIIEIKAARKRAEDTLTELRQTQKQLIQSEKMASLGELTAGIAHEIQNPLNFVNNFSDVNKELIQELNAERTKPKAERDEQLENEILNDLKENEEKINHHGKRADAIVKGMLQHSRKSSGQKEPTDINALADEYLRLSYHGMRAKDKSFNAEMKTDFDESLGKINIISQDIGRVLLNLFNNAFYAVSKRQEAQGKEYEPTVSVSTKKSGNSVLITVSDNGNGIPQNIVDKIFQPFFTTKPTGVGTGLGLSLSYDIVKAHGGEIKVESKEGEGSKFVIQIAA